MPTVLQLRRGTTAQNNAFTGSAGELTFNTTTGALRAHDGTTAGGAEMLLTDFSNAEASGVTANTYGSATAIPQITVDTYGRITSATTVAVSSDMSISSDSGSGTITVGTDTFAISGGTNINTAISGDTLTINLDASTALSGTPTAPTATAGTSTTQIATTAFVSTAITNLIGGAPGALDTLNELAAAINDDASYASTVTTALGTKVATNSAQALGSAANVLTISGSTITLARGDSSTDTVSINSANIGDATSSNTANTVVKRDASGNFSAGVITATTTAARYADLAEKYTPDAEYTAGTVLMFGGNAEVTIADEYATRRVAGVVSTNPAFMMNESLENGVYIALTGRVPCRVTGIVNPGDLIVASATAGVATAWDDPLRDPPAGSVIGKAIQGKALAGEELIEVVVGVR